MPHWGDDSRQSVVASAEVLNFPEIELDVHFAHILASFRTSSMPNKSVKQTKQNFWPK